MRPSGSVRRSASRWCMMRPVRKKSAISDCWSLGTNMMRLQGRKSQQLTMLRSFPASVGNWRTVMVLRRRRSVIYGVSMKL